MPSLPQSDGIGLMVQNCHLPTSENNSSHCDGENIQFGNLPGVVHSPKLNQRRLPERILMMI